MAETKALRDVFLDLFRNARLFRLVAIDQEAQRAVLTGADVTPLRDERQALLDLPDRVTTDDRAALVALWPTSSLGDLPVWFANPAEAEKIDPPTTEDHGVDLAPPPEPEPSAGDPVEIVDLAAKAMENRAARKDDDDARREAWLAEVAAKRTASLVRLGLVNEKRKAKGWPEIDADYWNAIGEDEETAMRSR